jgi:hypothetical protein
MKDKIQILREKALALASEARMLKCEADEADMPAVFGKLESVEDFFDYATDNLAKAAEAVDAKEAF